MSVESQLRFWRHVEALYACGPRAIGELLKELGARYMIMTQIESTLERYARLDPAVLRALGGDKPPPVPLHEVQK